MKILIAVLIALGISMTGALPAVADWDAEDIAEIVKEIKEGKEVTEGGSYPTDYVQRVSFGVGVAIYLIDIRAKLCFYAPITSGVTLVPCKAIKLGYPLFAPIITWED